MDGWMDGWMDGRTDGRTDGRIDNPNCKMPSLVSPPAGVSVTAACVRAAAPVTFALSAVSPAAAGGPVSTCAGGAWHDDVIIHTVTSNRTEGHIFFRRQGEVLFSRLQDSPLNF